MRKRSTIQGTLAAVCMAALLGFSGCSMESMADQVARKIKERQDVMYEGEKQASAEKRKGFAMEEKVPEVDLAGSVEWHDTVLSQGIADLLEMEVSEITYEDLAKVKEFTLSDHCKGTVDSLEDLKYMTGLEVLDITGDSGTFQIAATDFSCLGELTGLKSLILDSVLVEEPSFVAHLTNLTELFMIECGLKDISFIEPLPLLENVSFYGNYLIDISPLAGHNRLSVISLAYNQFLTDITPLAELPALNEAGLHYCMISDISPLYGLENLEMLNLSGNPFADISGLSNLTGLQVLGLEDCGISDISPLENLTEMTWLQLGDNQVKDISPLSGMTKLSRLELNQNQISDFTPLQNMHQLFRLNLYQNPIEKVPENLMGIPYLDITKLFSWITEKGVEQAEQEEALAFELLQEHALPDETGYPMDMISGYLNEDSYEDIVVLVRNKESQFYHLYVFLGDKNGKFTPAAVIPSPDNSNTQKDTYYGMVIVNHNLIVSHCQFGQFGWMDNYYFQIQSGKLVQTQMTSMSYCSSSTGADFYEYDFIHDTSSFSVYVMQDNRMNRFLLQEGDSSKRYQEEENHYPELDSYYDYYCFQNILEGADEGFEAILQKEFTEYEKRPLSYTDETMKNYSKLIGTWVPDYYYEADGGSLYFASVTANAEYEVFQIYVYQKDGNKNYYLYNIDTKEVVTKTGTQYNEAVR